MLMPYDMPFDLEMFCTEHSNEHVIVILHTSIVFASKEDIIDILSKRNCIVLKDCLYELKLLAKLGVNKIFREHARLVLERVNSVNWKTSDLWNNPDGFKAAFHCDIPVYVFFEPASAESFVMHMSQRDDFYYLSYDPFIKLKQDKNCKDIMYSCIPQPTTKRLNRKCIPIRQTGVEINIDPNGYLELADENNQLLGKRINVSDLKIIGGGGEGKVYETSSMPGQVIKIYKDAPCDDMVTKLCWLMQLSGSMPHCIQPQYLIYHKGTCVGYVMKKVEGVTFLQFHNNIDSKPRNEIDTFIVNLTKVLLNLRLLQFCVTDLSMGNVWIDQDGRVRILDCDSSEFCCFPGGGFTVPFGHPGLTADYPNKRLRLREHADFSYSVMLYQCIMKSTSPLQQRGFEGPQKHEDWGKFRFPLANDKDGNGVVVSGAFVNPKRVSLWQQLPLAVRQNFVDTFTFAEVPNIGSWIIALDSMIQF